MDTGASPDAVSAAAAGVSAEVVAESAVEFKTVMVSTLQDVQEAATAVVTDAPEEKKADSKTEAAGPLKPVSYKTLLQYSTKQDKMFLAVGCAFEAACGAGFPFMILLFGGSLDQLSTACPALSSDPTSDLMTYIILGCVMWALRSVSTFCIGTHQKRAIARYRVEYMKSIIRQDIGWYDVNNPQELSSAFGDALMYIEKGLGFSGWGMLAQNVGMALSAVVIAFVYQPIVTLIAYATTPTPSKPSA
jgi:ATP-binding cassette subfamily B (MDR/TAP) protein 1